MTMQADTTTKTPTKPPKNVPRPDPFAVADKVDRALHAAPFHSTPAQDNAQRVNATQGDAEQVKPTHGNKVRVTAYMSVQDATSVQAIARAGDRSDSYIAGQLIAEALERRRADLRAAEKGAA
jgi:hypothetical protein